MRVNMRWFAVFGCPGDDTTSNPPPHSLFRERQPVMPSPSPPTILIAPRPICTFGGENQCLPTGDQSRSLVGFRLFSETELTSYGLRAELTEESGPAYSSLKNTIAPISSSFGSSPSSCTHSNDNVS